MWKISKLNFDVSINLKKNILIVYYELRNFCDN